jgi:hypothetical protein
VLQQMVRKILLETSTSVLISTVKAIALGQRENRQSAQDLDLDVEAYGDDNGDDLSQPASDTADDEPENEREDPSEAQEIFERIKDTIASLFRLAILIRKATPRDRYAKAVGDPNPFIEDFDVSHVGHKFEKLNTEASRWLKERLGKAITLRREYLRYAREHRARLGKVRPEFWKPSPLCHKTINCRFSSMSMLHRLVRRILAGQRPLWQIRQPPHFFFKKLLPHIWTYVTTSPRHPSLFPP